MASVTAVHKVKIRPLAVEHLQDVVAIERVVYNIGEAWPEEFFASELERGYTRYLVLLIDGKVVGYAGSWNLLEEMEVACVTIAPAWQGQGLGALLFANLVQYGLEEGVKAGTLEVRVDNEPALSVYRRFGFVTVGTRRRYYEGIYDASLMRVENMQDEEYKARVAEAAKKVKAGFVLE